MQLQGCVELKLSTIPATDGQRRICRPRRDVWRYFAFPGTFHALLAAAWHRVRGVASSQQPGDKACEAERPQDGATYSHSDLDW